MERHVRYEASEGVAHVTLDRVAVRNALDLDMLAELKARLEDSSDDPSVHALLLSASGPAFCAGMNLKAVDLSDSAQAAAFARELADVYLLLMTLPMPVLCAVNGPVSGGGVGLVAACDLVWVGPDARFALPETRLGLVPALVSVPLGRRVGARTLGTMALGGNVLGALRAIARGLADFATEGDPGDTARAFVSDLLRDHAPGALARTKAFFAGEEREALEHRLVEAALEFEQAVATDEARRGLDAFRRKESVRWDRA